MFNREVAAAFDVNIVYDSFNIFNEFFLDELLGLNGSFCFFSLHLLIHIGGKHLSCVPSLTFLMLPEKSVSNLLAFGLADSVSSLKSVCL